MTNEDITATNYTRNDNNEPVQPQLDSRVLNVMQEMVKIMAEQVAVMDSIPPALENIPQNEPVQIITQPDSQDIITKDEPDLNDLVKIKDEIADVIDIPNQADIISTPDLINIPPNNLVPTPEDIGLVPPERTGIQEVDDKNYNEYLDTLQQIRPDPFISDDEISEDDKSDDDVVEPVVEPKVEPKVEPDFTPFVDVDRNVLIKTETHEIPTSDVCVDSDIESDTEVTPPVSEDETIPYVADSDSETVIYTKPKFGKNKRDEIYRIRAKKRALKTLAKKKLQSMKKKNSKKTHILVPTDVPITSNDPMDILSNPNVSTILPPQIKTEDDYDIDFNLTDSQIVWDEDKKDLVPLEFDSNKVIMTDDGDVILTEPDNMQVEEKQLIPLSNDWIMLPLEEDMTDIISTKNILLKRKQPYLPVAQIKKIKNETDISITNTIKHPIFRKMEKEKKATDRLTRILSQGKPLEIRIKDELLAIEDSPSLPALEASPTLLALMPPSVSRPLATVDAETMQRIPWVDFNIALDNTEKYNREQVIFDILQANMPNSGDDIYYVYQDPETNVFSIKADEIAEEIQDVKLALESLSKKERNYLLKVRSLKIKELRKTYGANVLADVLDNKLSESKKNELEDQVIEILKELNQDEDRYYFEFNEETQEFEILLDSEVRINAIVFAVMQIDKVIRDVNTTHTRKLKLMTEKDKLLDYLKEKGAKTLANSLR